MLHFFKFLHNPPACNLREHRLRHDDRIFKLLEHQVVVASACRFIVASQTLVQLHHIVRGHHQLVDESSAELSCD